MRRQALTGLATQLTQGSATAGIILVIRGQGGSLALAGAVVGGMWIAAGVARPIQGRAIDRGHAVGLLRVCAVVHPAALAAIVAIARVHALRWSLLPIGVLGGLALPPVSTAMRVALAGRTAEHDRTAAYSLVYLTQELSILAGPLILAAATAAFSSSLAVLLIAALASAGGLAFAASVSSAGVVPAHRPGAAGVLRSPGMRVLLAVTVLLGGVIGALQVAAPAFAAGHHAPAAAGLLIAALSVGGILGAAIYGARRWRADPARRLVALLAAVTVALGVLLAARAPAAVALLLLITGIPFNPALTTCSLLVDRHVAAGSAAEAFGWLSTTIAGGTGIGSIVAAAAAQTHNDALPAFAVAAAAGAAATAAALLTRRLLSRGRGPAGLAPPAPG